jgi:hypothetical protein
MKTIKEIQESLFQVKKSIIQKQISRENGTIFMFVLYGVFALSLSIYNCVLRPKGYMFLVALVIFILILYVFLIRKLIKRKANLIAEMI